MRTRRFASLATERPMTQEDIVVTATAIATFVTCLLGLAITFAVAYATFAAN